jgi:hypothetical protein
VQIRGSKAPLTWGDDTGGLTTNIGGDYWSKTLAFNVGDTVRYKIFVGTDAWEADITPDPASLPGDPNRGYIVANRDTTLPVQFFNNLSGRPAQYFRPWTAVSDTFMNVYFRVNLQGVIEGGLFGYNPAVDTVGIRGGGPTGGDLNWSPTFYLQKETNPSNGGSFGLPASTFISGRVRIPKSSVTTGSSIEYKYLVGFDWGRDELQGQPNRSFVVPTGKRDTTIKYVYFNNTRPSGRRNTDTTRVTFLANMARAISTGGFAIGDTVVVRSGYFGTGTQSGREKRLLRQGLTSNYQSLDTIVTSLSRTLDYQYYVIKNGVEVRENYYNFFYAGEVPSEAERRQILSVPGSVFTIADTASSITVARRQPVFPNQRRLLRNVNVKWEVDLRPAYYQVTVGRDTLRDIQGNLHITRGDTVIRGGVWINGPATNGWATWGLSLRQDTTRKMWDDGTHGDRIANDSIFTRQILASPDSLNIGSKSQVGQVYKFGIIGGDNEGGRGGFGNNHLANIDDATSTYTLPDQWGSINPAFYDCWDFDLKRPRACATSVIEIPGLPVDFKVSQNYPNPFNPVTTIEFTVPVQAHVTLKVYNTLGQEVATLVNGEQKAANYIATWDAKDFASGIYFYKLTAGNFFSSTKKMVLLK